MLWEGIFVTIGLCEVVLHYKVWIAREYDDILFNKGVLFWQTSGRESWGKNCLFLSFQYQIFFTPPPFFLSLLLSRPNTLGLIMAALFIVSIVRQCVITWSHSFTAWSTCPRSTWWTVYWRTSLYFRYGWGQLRDAYKYWIFIEQKLGKVVDEVCI